MAQIMMNPTAESIYEEVRNQYDIDDRRMSKKQINAVNVFFWQIKIIKSWKKGKIIKNEDTQ